jgi:hypothetical protein
MQHQSPAPTLPRPLPQQTEFPFNHPASMASASTPKVTSYGPGPLANARSMSVFGVSGDEMNKHHEEQKSFGAKRETCVQPFFCSDEGQWSDRKLMGRCGRRLVSALDSTTGLVKGLAAFNQEKCEYSILLGHDLAPFQTAMERTAASGRDQAGLHRLLSRMMTGSERRGGRDGDVGRME